LGRFNADATVAGEGTKFDDLTIICRGDKPQSEGIKQQA
jgi:hypothetical protein